MPSDELTAEIEQAAQEMADVNVEAADETTASEKAAQEAADASAQSDEEKAAAEVASADGAADAEAAATEAAAQKSADEEAAAAKKAGQEAASDTVSDELLERAVDVDISVADARSLPLASLERIVKAREEYAAADIAAKEQAAKAPDGQEDAKDPFADLPKLDPEVHAPEVIGAFEKYAKILKQQHETARQQQETIEALQGRQEETSLVSEARAAAEVEKWFDEQVAKLGEEFSEALGTGDYRSLSQGSSQYAKREAIAKQTSVLIAGYDATNQQRPPCEELFKTAARLVLSDEYQAIHNKKVAGDLESQSSQHLQRAEGRKAVSTQTPEEEAAAAIDAKFG